MESADSSSGSQQPQLPPGFRFHPTDEELVVHYLKKKVSSTPLPIPIIAEVDLYKFDPWELPGKASFGEHEWYFFSPRDRKYPNGARPNRAATSGYWKATGTDKPILTAGGSQKIGVKKALVFYGGRPPKGIKTDWIMHEYRIIDNEKTNKPPCTDSKKTSLRLDDWVLCRIYKKNNSHRSMERDKEDSIEEILAQPMNASQVQQTQRALPQKQTHYGTLLDNDEHFFNGLLTEEGMNSNPITHLTSASRTKPDLSNLLAGGTLSLKRTGTPPNYWSEQLGSSTPPAKRIHSTDGSSTGTVNSVATLLNQLQQGDPFHHQGVLGLLGDGSLQQQYQQSGMNWNS